MNRKEFIHRSSMLLSGGILGSFVSCDKQVTTKPASRTNWAGNYTYQASKLHEPRSIEEVPGLISKLGKQKALGSRHCFNSIADSPVNQISTRYLNKVTEIHGDQGAVTVESGIRYGELAPQLESRGRALHNLASLPHITIGGSVATGTHGSGVGNGNLSTAVRSLELITSLGDIVELRRGMEEFNGAVVGLGALGLITRLTLDTEPTFSVRQDVFTDLPLPSLQQSFDDIMSGGYSVSLFTDWRDEKISQIWIKRRMDSPITDLGPDFYGATAASRHVHPIIELSAENCTPQMGEPGPWHLRLPHFKMGFTPSSGDELQAEYFVARENAVDAILAIERLQDQIVPHLFISEIRTIASDNLWMSPSYGRESVAIHFTWKPHGPEVRKLLPVIEKELAPFDVRPHWGKLFAMEASILRKRYPKFDDFRALVAKYDPQGKLENDFLKRTILG